MVDYVLKRDENGMVRYMYRNDGKHPVVGLMKIESAEWMLRQGEVAVSEEYEGFPVTANGMYFFEAEVKGELPQSPTAIAPSGREPDDNAEIGADGLPLPAGADKPKRKRRDERPTEGKTEGASAVGEAARRARNSPPSEATGARRIKDEVCE